MLGTMSRITLNGYGSSEAFLAAVQRYAVGIAAAGTGGTGKGFLGIWLDDSRQGAFLRLVRDGEVSGLGEQSWAWRPHRLFQLHEVADAGVRWLEQEIGKEVESA